MITNPNKTCNRDKGKIFRVHEVMQSGGIYPTKQEFVDLDLTFDYYFPHELENVFTV